MKFILILLISFTASANWIKKSQVGVCQNLTVYMKSQKCGNDCIKIPQDYNCEYHEVVAETQMKAEVESCVDEPDCQAKLALKECSEGSPVYTLAPNEVYCTWLRPESVLVNSSLKSAWDAQKASDDAKKSVLAQIRSMRSCGEKVIDEMLYRNNALKSLTKGQKKQVLNTYAEIKGLLEVGNLDQAKDDINAVTADGTLVTEADKAVLVAMIDNCLGL